MARLIPFGGVAPILGKDAFIADGATLVGDVEVGEAASVWFGSVLRGDVGRIRIGARSNIQDLCCLHMTGGISDVEVGQEVTVGHGVILHGARVGDGALIGMGSVLLDNVEVGEEALVAAGSLLPPNTKVPPRVLVLGRPARVVRELDDSEIARGRDGARRYLRHAAAYLAGTGTPAT